MNSIVYLVPSLLAEDAVETIPAYLMDAVNKCDVLFVENERTTRRFLKKMSPSIVIDRFEWHVMDGAKDAASVFRKKIKEGKNIALLSEAGCPGVADPGQALISIAHEMNVPVNPLVGPSSILLALMGSGMNGQRFQFLGYLPVDEQERAGTLKKIEAESARNKCTQIFIETPYRNNQLGQAILRNCKPSTRLCVAVDLTGPNQWIKTKLISEWKVDPFNIHKRPAIFLMLA